MESERTRPQSGPLPGDPHGSIEQDVSAIQAAVENVTQNYLETLDALGTVYESATGFAQLFDSSSIACFTLNRVLESLEVERGAVFIETGGTLRFHYEAGDAFAQLNDVAVEDASLEGQSLFLNGESAAPYLRAEVTGHNVLLAPIVAAQRRLGIVVVLADGHRRFTTKDLKLVGAVTSQAAIALSGSQHLEQIMIERQKLRSIIEDSGGGIVVLSPDGRSVLTNIVARELLGLPVDGPEGLSLGDALEDWRFSRDPGCLRGEGPSEFRLELASRSGKEGRSLSAVGRRIRGTDGALVNIVLNLEDSTDKWRVEKRKQGLLSLLVGALRQPVLGLDTVAEAVRGSAPVEDLSGDLHGLSDDLKRILDSMSEYVEGQRSSAALDEPIALGRLLRECKGRLDTDRPEAHLDIRLEGEVERAQVPAAPGRALLASGLGTVLGRPTPDPAGARITASLLSAEEIELVFEGLPGPSDTRTVADILAAISEGEPPPSSGEADLVLRLAFLYLQASQLGGRLAARASAGGGTELVALLPTET